MDLFKLSSETILKDLEDLPVFIIGGHCLYEGDTMLMAASERKL